MKHGQCVLVIALSLGVCGFLGSRFLARESAVLMALQGSENRPPELECLRQWLQLNQTQFQQIKVRHLAYLADCQSLCIRVREAETALAAVIRDPEQDAEAALKIRADLQVKCQQAMLAHLRQTAALMNPHQAKLYLDTLLPYVLGINPAYPEHHLNHL